MGKRKGHKREHIPYGKRPSQKTEGKRENKHNDSAVAIYEVNVAPRRMSAFSRYAQKQQETPSPIKEEKVQKPEQQQCRNTSPSPKVKHTTWDENRQTVKSTQLDRSQNETDKNTGGQSEMSPNKGSGSMVVLIDSTKQSGAQSIHEEDGTENDGVNDDDADAKDVSTDDSLHTAYSENREELHRRKDSMDGMYREVSEGHRAGRDRSRSRRGHHEDDQRYWSDRDGHRQEGRSPRSHRSDQRGSDRRENRHGDRRKHYTPPHTSNPIRTFPVDAGNQCVVLTKLPESFSLWGCASVRSLLGDVDVCGFLVRQGAAPVDIFSPTSTSFITVTTTLHTTATLTETDVAKSLDELPGLADDTKNQILAEVEPESAVLVFAETTEKQRLDFVTGVSPFQQIFWSKDNTVDKRDFLALGSLPIAIAMHPGVKQIRISQEMNMAGKEFCASIQKGDMPSIAVCGGKNVGKSTMCRYLTNVALNKCHQVAYLECDVGQTEYSPPGCVSLHLVSTPALGPPFTHQHQAHRMLYFGAVSPGDDPQFYLQCVKAAMAAHTALQEPCPLVVNTMGWNQGLGLILLATTLAYTHPTYVVQIESDNRNRNLPPLTPQFVSEQDRWPTMLDDADVATPTHDLFKIPSAVDFTEFRDKYHPSDHRTLSLLGYLTRCQPRSGPCVPLHALPPQAVPWGHVGVHVAHAAVANSQIMYSLNANIVGLCKVPEHTLLSSDDESLPKFLAEKPVCECLGFGIIRGIDPVQKVFYIISELTLAESGVNCLVRACLQIPQNYIPDQPLVDGDIPYFGDSKDVHGATAIKRRRHLVRRGRVDRQHQQ